MTNAINFTFSDLIAGYVTEYKQDQDTFDIETSDNRRYTAHLTPTVYAELLRNLGESYHDATELLRDMLVPGRFLFVYGIFYLDAGNDKYKFEVKHIVFLGRSETQYSFEGQNWWIEQVKRLADFYLKAEFKVEDGKNIDYSIYRTRLTINGEKQKSDRQETDTISRLIYGFASAFLLTGEDVYLEAANKGVEYLREHMRFQDKSEGICYWYHAVDLKNDGTEEKIFASEFGDDYEAIACYEQIYALAGAIQTYRITGDLKILEDAEATISLFHRFFKDKTEQGGYYSHIDPISLSPHSDFLGNNKERKNWNSNGDHAPAYLINLWLATGKQEYADFLEYTQDIITSHFPDYDSSPFVQERFFRDWTKDQSWGWQQNRAVVGHNLKIAWNLTRTYNLLAKDSYKELAEKIGQTIPNAGADRQRGGWYDVVEREIDSEKEYYPFVWHNRKAWWQQEQGILAYYIMAGVYKDNPDFLRFAREGTSFYNAWMLDREAGGVYFNVLANGQPYALGSERTKGAHSMAGYHAFELCYLSAVYINLLISKEPMDLYFKPMPEGFPDNILRVAPDILPSGSVRIDRVWIDGNTYDDFDAEGLTVKLPSNYNNNKFRVRLYPTGIDCEVALLEANNGTARIKLSGNIEGNSGLRELKQELDRSEIQQAKSLVLLMEELTSISSEATRYLTFFLQRQEREVNSINVTAVGVQEQVKEQLERSQLSDLLEMIENW